MGQSILRRQLHRQSRLRRGSSTGRQSEQPEPSHQCRCGARGPGHVRPASGALRQSGRWLPRSRLSTRQIPPCRRTPPASMRYQHLPPTRTPARRPVRRSGRSPTAPRREGDAGLAGRYGRSLQMPSLILNQSLARATSPPINRPGVLPVGRRMSRICQFFRHVSSRSTRRLPISTLAPSRRTIQLTPGSAVGSTQKSAPEAFAPGADSYRNLEVPVLVFGDDGFADDVGGARTREEVVVLVGVG